jgi:hypothetical protein
LRFHGITVETEDDGAVDSAVVDRALEALERMPTVENASVDREYLNILGRKRSWHWWSYRGPSERASAGAASPSSCPARAHARLNHRPDADDAAGG